MSVSSFSRNIVSHLDSSPGTSAALFVSGLVGTLAFMSLMALILIYVERKVAAHFQCRLGPMRVGWHGILQSVADALKLILKEDIVPFSADKLMHATAPVFAVVAMLLTLIAIPLSSSLTLADSNIGVLYISAVSGLGVLGILLGGWSSNNKWSLIGAMRAGAQIISYELSATLSVLVIIMLSGSLKLSTIIQSQANGWWIWRAPGVGLIAFITFIISSTAEINRTPFDLAEGESELTAGFHTEYSGMRFAFFFLAEYLNLFVVSALGATLFLGGWMPLHIGDQQGLFSGFNQVMDLIPEFVWFMLKTASLIFLSMWFRWTFPRLRVDQLMKLEWKILMPIGFLNLVLAALMTFFGFFFFATGRGF